MFQLAYARFRAARSRFSDAISSCQEESAVGAALEAVYWAGRLDACLRAVDPGYECLAGPGADLMLAVRWLRHRAEHHIPLGGTSSDLRWVAGAELPSGPATVLVQSGSDAYEDQMAGRPALLVIDEIAAWFSAEQHRPGSLIASVEPDAAAGLSGESRPPV